MLKKIKLIRSQGFTLVELLVVITLIAILAVAVLATINPVEQRRKAIDVSLEATAAEYVNAQERYFAVYGCYTHNDSSGPGNCDTFSTVGPAVGTIAYSSNLVTAGEAKQSLLTRVGQEPFVSKVYFSIDSDELIHAAYSPESQQFRARMQYDDKDCTGTGTPAYYCVE